MGNSSSRSRSFPGRKRSMAARPSPTTLTGMVEFANTLNETFTLLQGLQEQIVINGNVATLTSAELDLLQRALHRLCVMQSREKGMLNTISESDIGAYDKVSISFLEHEYSTESFSVDNMRGSPLLSEPSRSLSIHSQKSSSAFLSHYLISNPAIEQYVDTYNNWGFDLLDLRENRVIETPLIISTMTALSIQGLIGTSLIKDESLIVEYIKKVEKAYYDNPYHNCWHAADVVQTMNYGLLNVPSGMVLPPYARFSAIIAAAVHDVGHLGVNNAFLISTSHQLALQFSDQSPLEMMHAQKAFSILHSPGCNYMKDYERNDKTTIRRMIITMVLQTDNAKHVQLLDGITRLRVSQTFNLESGDHQLNFLSLVLHSMDVCNVARPWKISRKWLELLLIEFYAQGDAEHASNIPVTPMMDRNSNVPLPKFQIGFINAIVKPLFVELQCCGMEIDQPLSTIEENLSLWESIVNGNATLETIDLSRNYSRPAFIEEIEKNPNKGTSSWLQKNLHVKNAILDSVMGENSGKHGQSRPRSSTQINAKNSTLSNSPAPVPSNDISSQVGSVARRLMRGITNPDANPDPDELNKSNIASDLQRDRAPSEELKLSHSISAPTPNTSSLDDSDQTTANADDDSIPRSI